MTTKQIANLLIDNYKGIAPAVFSNGLTPDQQISEAFLDVMGLTADATSEDVQMAFRQEKVRLGVFSIIEEVIHEGIINESWRNPFFELFVETRSQKRGDKTVFYIESRNEVVVSRISKDGKVALDRQRFDEGDELDVKVATYGVKVYEHLARIVTGRAGWDKLVARLYEAVEQFIAEKCYATFASVCDNLPTQFIHHGSYNRKKIKEAIRNVKMVSGASSVALIGTSVALDYLNADENNIDYLKSEKARTEIMENGRIGKWYGETVIELPNAFKQGTGLKETVMKDDIVYIIPVGVEKPVKMVVEPELMDINESGVRVDDTVELAVRFSFGCNVICGVALGTIKEV